MCKCVYKYRVSLYFEVIDDDGVFVDCYSVEEYYDTFSEFSERVSFLRENIGEAFHSSDDCAVVLRDFHCDYNP